MLPYRTCGGVYAIAMCRVLLSLIAAVGKLGRAVAGIPVTSQLHVNGQHYVRHQRTPDTDPNINGLTHTVCQCH